MHFTRVFLDFAPAAAFFRTARPEGVRNSKFQSVVIIYFNIRVMGFVSLILLVLSKEWMGIGEWGDYYYSRWTKYSNPAARTMLNPRTPKSQCLGARVTKSDVRGLIFLRPLGLMHFRLH